MKTAKSGMIETVKDDMTAAIKDTGNVVQSAVKTVAEFGKEVETAATGLVAGAIKGGKKLGVQAEDAATAAVGGALKAADEAGSATVTAVRKIVGATK